MSSSSISKAKTAFYLGAYQRCINDLNNATDISDNERDVWMSRALIAQRNYDAVIAYASDANASSIETQALVEMAKYLKVKQNINVSDESGTVALQAPYQKLMSWLNAGADNNVVLLCCATVQYIHSDYAGALETVMKVKNDLDLLALSVQILLVAYSRVDLARSQIERMNEIDDDSILTQLSTISLNIYMSGENLEKAYYIAMDLSKRYTRTAILVGYMAICRVKQLKYEEAETLLKEQQEKDPHMPTTCTNMMVVAQLTGRSELFKRMRSRIPNGEGSALLEDLDKKQQMFDALCMELSTPAAA